MSKESAVRKSKSDKFSEILKEARHNDDLLIPTSRNPPEEPCARLLKTIFFSLVVLSFLSVFLIVSTDHNTSGFNEESVLLKVSNRSQIHPIFEALKTPDLCQLSSTNRFDCHPGPGATEEACLSRRCCWNPLENPRSKAPWCFYPSGFSYYTLSNFTNTNLGLKGSADIVRYSAYPRDVSKLKIDVIYETEDVVRIKITDIFSSRYEVPLDYKTTAKKAPKQNYVVEQNRNGVKVYRKNSQFPLFDSTVAPMVFSDQFLEISTSLVSSNLFGIGEVIDSLNKGAEWKKYTLFNRGQASGPGKNLYGSHPFFMSLDKAGNAHGVFLANSNAMEIVVQPGNFLTFRTIGGILDFRIFLGPRPSDVMAQYTGVIGRPMLPPYWSLGFHLCRYNYGTLNHTAEILENNLKAGIPVDVQWNDLDYMENRDDFTVDPKKFAGLKTFVENLHERGMRYVPLIDPGISAGNEEDEYKPYLEGLEMNVFIKNSNGTPFIGNVWNPNGTVWPDFSHPNATRYWFTQLKDFREKVEFDGTWIDMNEPDNFDDGEHGIGCSNVSSLDHPPYLPPVTGGKLYSRTICPSVRQTGGYHYNLHNLYGTMQTMSTYKALNDVKRGRPFIISRSTFPGQGKYGGHWTGDIASTWGDMKQTIPQIVSFGLFGIPMVGADICGFNGNTTVDLCKRWMQLGAFYPFMRNHNTYNGIPQDPASLGPEIVEASREALTVRYTLLPYIYTLFFHAHLTGQPVARGLFYEFPQDPKTHSIESSFMLGPAVMVIPILEKNYTKPKIRAYLPAGWWYQHYFPEILQSFGEEHNLKIPQASIPVLYRGGTIIMKQEPALNTKHSRENRFHIQAFLSIDGNATGDFYWDDGDINIPDSLIPYWTDHYVFKAENGLLTVEKRFGGYDSSNMTLGSIEIRGVVASVTSALINNEPCKFDYSSKSWTLKVEDLNLTGKSWTDGFTLQWS